MSPFQKTQLKLEERRKEMALLLDNEDRAEDFTDKLGVAKRAIEAAQDEVAAAALAEPDPEVKEEARYPHPKGRRSPSFGKEPSSASTS